MSREVSPKMRAVYDARKQETLKKVQSAIDQLKASGEKITKKKLAEVSGLSSGTFSKDHVKALLAENQVCQYAPGTKRRTNFYASRPVPKSPAHLNSQDVIHIVNNRTVNDEDKIIKEQEKAIAALQKRQENLKFQLLETQKQYERLLGQYELAARILNNMGVKIDVKNDNGNNSNNKN